MADELAGKLGTINYEIVTAISSRLPRLVTSAQSAEGRRRAVQAAARSFRQVMQRAP